MGYKNEVRIYSKMKYRCPKCNHFLDIPKIYSLVSCNKCGKTSNGEDIIKI